MNIRKFIARARRLDDLVRGGSLTPTAARFLDAAVDAGMNILVSGATHTGVKQGYFPPVLRCCVGFAA